MRPISSTISNQYNLLFNTKQPDVMHIDINSCFATIEQQANPHLRGKPTIVAAYETDRGCVLAASTEAKVFGIKTGMRVKEARKLCQTYQQRLMVLEPDPPKYKDVHVKLKNLLQHYSNIVTPKSIDEFVLDMSWFITKEKLSRSSFTSRSKDPSINPLLSIAKEIKQRIKNEIGEWITVSIGIGPNRFLAKTGAGLTKPNGLDIINKDNYMRIYEKLKLTDLYGIANRNAARLESYNVNTVVDFYYSDIKTLNKAFSSINGYYWYLRLHGWETDDIEFDRKSYGNSYALPKGLTYPNELAPILYKLVEKTAKRLRHAGYKAKGVHVALNYKDGSFWHHGHTVNKYLFDSRDIYKEAYSIMIQAPTKKPVAILAESCFSLSQDNIGQLDMFDDLEKKIRLVESLDNITDKWGEFTIVPGLMINTKDQVPDRIAFGRIKEI